MPKHFFAIAAACLFTALSAPALRGAVITVTTTVDENDTPSGPNVSLREALRDAAASPGADTISFAPGLNGATLVLGSEIVVNDAAGVTIDATVLPAGVTISGNSSARIFSVGSGANVTLLGLTLTGGNGTGAANGGNGGAIFNNGTVTATACTFSANSASDLGGAFANASGGIASFTRCTFSGNQQTSAGGNGGGALNHSSGAVSMTLTHCTLAGNSSAISGGGIRNRGPASSLTLSYCLIAGNTAGAGNTPQDVNSTVAVNLTGTNLIQAALAGGGSYGGTGSAPLTTAPSLGALASNGGPTQTRALLAGSAGIDPANTGDPATVDQRGILISDVPDLGAFEFNVGLTVTTTNDSGPGSLRAAVGNAALLPGADSITFAPALAGQAVGLTTDLSIADAAGITLNTTVTGGSVDVAVNAGTLSFGAGSAWTGNGKILLGASSGSAAATVELNGPDGFSLAAPITVRAGSSGVKTLRGAHVNNSFSSTNTYAGDITLQAPATVERTVGSGTTETISFSGKMDLGPYLLTVNSSDDVRFTGQVGRFDGTGTAQVVFNGSGALELQGSGDNPRLTATVNGGSSLALGKASSGSVHALGGGLGAGTTALTVAATAAVSVSGNGSGGDQIADSASVMLNGAFDLYASETFDALNGSGTVSLQGDDSTLTLGAGNGSGSFSGTLNDSGLTVLSLTKTGSGTQTVAGDGMSGTVLVSGGTLNVTGSFPFSNGSTVQGGATLAGTGTVNNLTLQSGGFLAPGDATVAGSIGTLNVSGGATWNGGATARFHLGATGASADKLALTGALTKGSGSGFVFDFQGTGAEAQTYTLATFASSGFVAADFSATNLAPGLRGFFTLTGTSLTFTTYGSTAVTTTVDSGVGSLRQALLNAASNPGADTIVFSASFSGPIVLGSEIVLNGVAGNDVTIDASNLSGGVTVSRTSGSNRFFSVSSTQTVLLNNLTLSGGNGAGATDTGNGGALYNLGTLTLTDCTVNGNTASRGGGIWNNIGATLSLTRCTISGNSCSVDGGGLFLGNATATLLQCTVSGNSASFDGAGIYTIPGSTTTMTHCTVAGNNGNPGNGASEGGGMMIRATVNLANSIFAGNAAGTGPDIRLDTAFGSPVLNRSGVNFIGDLNSTGLSASGTLLTGNALLAPLADYGGPTKTRALLPTSPARNASSGSTITSDQRGFAITDGHPDLGAYEAAATVGAINNYNAFIWETLPTAGNGTLTDPLHASTYDYDGDGVTNYNEWLARTDPTSAASWFRVTQTAMSSNTISVTFPSVSGRTYQLQSSPNLTSPWTDVLNATAPGTGGNVTLQATITGQTQYFFHVNVQ